jgi:Helix-turn-helix domain
LDIIWMTAKEAEEKWGLKSGTVRSSCIRGPLTKQVEKGLARKSGGTWLVTDLAMRKVYGEPKGGE